jgi:ribosomal protein S18 acetylase RimI-like enzyme
LGSTLDSRRHDSRPWGFQLRIRRTDREDYLLRQFRQAAELLRRLRERLTGATAAPAAVRRDAVAAVDALLGAESPLLRRLDAPSAARLLGHPAPVAAWADLLDLQTDAARREGDAPAGDALAARARALRVAVSEAWPLDLCDPAIVVADPPHVDPAHVDAAWAVLARCRDALAASGVPQWDEVYPTRAVVAADAAAGTLHLLVEGGRVLGAVTVDARQDPEYAAVAWAYDEPALVVHRLCVDPEAQGRGLGARLMAHVEALGAARGYRSVRLDAYSANPASVALYRRRGYREAGQVHFARRPLPFHCFERAVPPVSGPAAPAPGRA